MQNSFWDPVDGEITPDSLKGALLKLEKKYQELVAHPSRPMRNLILCWIPLVVFVAAFFLLPKFGDFLEKTEKSNNFIGEIFFATLIPPLWYMRHIRNLQRDLIKRLIADKKGWLYSPNESAPHWGKMAVNFPEFFNKGNEGQNLQDEFWGTFQGDHQAVPFYSGIFEYVVVTRGSRGRRHRSYYSNTVFAIHLNKSITADFRLEPETVLHRFFNWFRKKEINTESAEFNKAFAVYYKGAKMERELDIVKILSPAVQVKLIELKNREGSFGILFKKDVMIVKFDRDVFKKMRTNFFQSVAFHPGDEEEFSTRLKSVLEIGGEIVPFLD